MKHFILYLLVIVIFVGCEKPGKRNKINDQHEIELVSNAIHNCIGWAKGKDLELLYSIIANDSNYLEVSPSGSVVRGIAEFKQNEELWLDTNFKAIRYDISELKITLSQSGNVAWFYCLLNDINEWKGQSASWENTRWTGVLEKRDNKWRMVQMHFSFAIE